MDACAGEGLEIVALTDHDTVAGVEEAQVAAGSLGLEVVTGCEISVEFEGQDLHLLSYFIDLKARGLADYLRLMESRRLQRIERVIDRLDALGVPVSMEQVLAQARAAKSVGRPHIARALMDRGWVTSYEEAFARYLRDGGPAYVAKETATLDEVVDVVGRASGCVVLAHPGTYDLTRVIPELKRVGIAGIEVHHPAHSEEQTEAFSALAEAEGWVATGGSDFHGSVQNLNPVGSPRVSRDIVEELRRRTEG
jgi:predicted metal-dependent phosphoesterase TrpH